MKMINFSKIEQKWQKKWEEKRVFEAGIDKKKEKFFFTTPYPYISGSLHIGHGRAVVESDIYCRYKRMKGFNVLYPMAFHISGTPVLGISSAIKNRDKKMISLYEEYVSAYVKDKGKVGKIVMSFADPQKIVYFFIPLMIDEYKMLGIGVDWTRSFTSGDFSHRQMVDWQFRKYNELGFLKKEKYPILYSIKDESAMGEDDIKDGDINLVEKMEFTILKFKFKDKFLVAATLRPETVFGQTNLWINSEVKYHEAKVGNEIWILSAEAIEKLKYQRKDVESLGFTKEKLIGGHVTAPMINRELIVLPSNFVDADVGTGIVTSVPSDAPYDYAALKELQGMKETDKKKNYGFSLKQIEEIEDIEVIPIIKTEKYGDKAGVKVVEDSQIVLTDDSRLEKLTREVYREGFHNGTMLEICEKYAGMKVVEAKEKIRHDMIQKKWADVMCETSRKALSRSGSKIIVAVLDNQWFLDFNSNKWKDKAYQCLKNVEIVPENTRKQFEDTFVWLDKRPCARKRGFGTQLPLDKNWVIESLSDSTIYMTLYTINNLIKKYKLKKENLNYDFFEYVYLGNGSPDEVSKKTGIKREILKEFRDSFEYWMPVDHRHTFVLHLSNHLAFMLFAFAGLFDEKYWPKKISFHGLVVSEGEKMSKSKGNTITLLDIKKKFGADAFRFYMTYSTNIFGTFDWRDKEADNAKATLGRVYFALEEILKKRKKGNLRNYYIHKFEKIKKEATEKIEEMNFRDYNRSAVFDMFNLIGKAKISLDKKELGAFYNCVAEDWIKMISPVMPHIAEELWSKLGKKNFVSLEKWPSFDESKINEEFDKQDEVVERVISDINNIKKIVNVDKPRVCIYTIPSETKLYSDNKEMIKTASGAAILSIYPTNYKNIYDPDGKSKKAKPGKPGIFVE